MISPLSPWKPLQHLLHICYLRSSQCFCTWWFWVLERLAKGGDGKRKPKDQGGSEQNWGVSLALQSPAAVLWPLTGQWTSAHLISHLFSVLVPAESFCLHRGGSLTCCKYDHSKFLSLYLQESATCLLIPCIWDMYIFRFSALYSWFTQLIVFYL